MEKNQSFKNEYIKPIYIYSIRISTCVFFKLDKAVLKLIWKTICCRITNNSRNNDNDGILALLDINAYHKVAVIKSILFGTEIDEKRTK